jgi:hypothetical protein
LLSPGLVTAEQLTMHILKLFECNAFRPVGVPLEVATQVRFHSSRNETIVRKNVTIQAGTQADTPGGQKGVPSTARRNACSTG